MPNINFIVQQVLVAFGDNVFQNLGIDQVKKDGTKVANLKIESAAKDEQSLEDFISEEKRIYEDFSSQLDRILNVTLGKTEFEKSSNG